ncbi:hypothetical protein SUGI_0431010 [Cryptomeria japonica]|nr:hypothetical protein SUGI_0431010 [Cryptomeria japonica]
MDNQTCPNTRGLCLLNHYLHSRTSPREFPRIYSKNGCWCPLSFGHGKDVKSFGSGDRDEQSTFQAEDDRREDNSFLQIFKEK